MNTFSFILFIIGGLFPAVPHSKPLHGPVVYRSPMFYLPYCGGQSAGQVYATVQVTIHGGNCPPVLNSGCPVVNVTDSASHASWPLPVEGKLTLPARRTYFVCADLANVTDSLVNKFYVAVEWEECD